MRPKWGEEMLVPTIHSNGTSKESLTNDLEDAYYKIQLAYDALKRCAPNGRDYYLQGAGALSKATDEHMARLKHLDIVMVEIQELCEKINEQGN
jgi:hypothetical protein